MLRVQRPSSVQGRLPPLRQTYGRRLRGYTFAPEGCIERDPHHEVTQEKLQAMLTRLKSSSPHFRNLEFRLAYASHALADGTLAAALKLGPPLELRRAWQPGGPVCAVEQRCVVEIKRGVSALDAALDLQEAAHVMKPGVLFAGHPAHARTALVSHEERELLARTNWSTAFIDATTRASLQSPGGQEGGQTRPAVAGPPCLEAGSPCCLFAEDLAVLRREGTDQFDGRLVETPKELPAALCFLPRPMTGSYSSLEDKLEYRRQVVAALQVCCLLHLDAVCVGCAEGIAGSDLFGHPLEGVADVWRDVLQDRGPSGTEVPLSSHFKRVVFASAKENPKSSVHTPSVLRKVLDFDAL